MKTFLTSILLLTFTVPSLAQTTGWGRTIPSGAVLIKSLSDPDSTHRGGELWIYQADSTTGDFYFALIAPNVMKANVRIRVPDTLGTAGQTLTLQDDSTFVWTTPAGTGDITGVTAGDGLTGGGLSGDVTLDINPGTDAGDASTLTLHDLILGSPSLNDVIRWNGSNWIPDAETAGGSNIILDLADDESNESTALSEIATNGDVNSIFTEPSADKLLIDVSLAWPVADSALDVTDGLITNAHVNASAAIAANKLQSTVMIEGENVSLLSNDAGYLTSETGDIEGVTAGRGITGGGTSGTVTVNLDTAAAMTLTGNWINTANPWAANELVSTVIIEGENVSLLANDAGYLTAETGDIESVTAGVGLGGGGVSGAVTLDALVDFDGGIEIIDDSLNIKLDGSTLSLSTSGLKVNTIGSNEITDGQIALVDLAFDPIIESELDSESELESQLADVTDVFTNNDGALSDDDLSNNNITDLSDVTITSASVAHILVRNAGNTAFENVALSGDGSISATGALTINDDSHAHTTTTISSLDASDITTGLSDVLGTSNAISITGGTARVIGGDVTVDVSDTLATKFFKADDNGGFKSADDTLYVLLANSNTAFKIAVSTPAADKILKSDASGILTFQDDETGGTGGGADVKIRNNGTLISSTPVVLEFSTHFLVTDANVADSVEISIAANSIGAAEIDETENYTWTGQHDFDSSEILSANALRFEGATDDNIYTIFSFTDPTVSNNTITFPNASGEASLLGQTIESSEISDNEIVNADINASAGIVYSKLSFSDNIVAGDIATDAIGSTELNDGADTPNDEDIVTYESTGGVFEYHTLTELGNNDSADDLSDNSIDDLNDVTISAVAAAHILVRNAGNTAFENVALSGDGSITAAGVLTVNDDSHAHTTTTISGLDISDDTNLSAQSPIILSDDQVQFDQTANLSLTGANEFKTNINRFIADGDSLHIDLRTALYPFDLEINDTRVFAVDSSGNVVVNGTVDGIDIAARDHDPVTLAGSLDYITISGQVITRNAIDIADLAFDPITEGELDSESEFESQLTDVTNVFTNNDGALADDDLSDNNITDLSDVAAKTGGGTTVVFSTTPTFTTSIITPIIISGDADPADTGMLRLGNAELIAWEASPAGTDITLSVDASEIMQVSGAFNAAGNITGANLSGTNTGDESLSTSSAGIDVSDHAIDLDVTPSSGSATLEQSEDALQVKYDSEALTEGVSGLTITAGGVDGGLGGDIADNSITADDLAAGAVTNTELADMAAYTVKLRNDGSSGDPQDVKVSTLTELGAPGAGDWILGEASTGELRKIDVGDLPTGGGGEVNDDITVNGTAATDADFDDTTPAAPTNSINVNWQITGSNPSDISANILLTEIDQTGTITSQHDITVAGLSFTTQNTTDAASNQIATFGSGNRAIPADNDEGYLSLFHDDDLGTQVEFSRITSIAEDVTNTTKDSRIEFDVIVDNTLTNTFDITGTGVDVTGNIIVSGTVDGVDIAARDHDAVTLSGTPDYITLSGQDIIRGLIDLSTDVTGVLPDANIADAITIDGGTIQNSTIILLDGNAASPTTDGELKFDRTTERLQVGDGTGTNEFHAGAHTTDTGDEVSIDGGATTNPDFVSTDDIDFINTANTITAAINSGVIINTDINASAAIDVSKTALIAGTNITLNTNTLDVDDAFVINSGDDIMAGTLTADGFTLGDDENITLGTESDWTINFDDSVDDQLLIATTKDSAITITDPMLQILVNATPKADQQIFGIAKGTQATNTDLMTLDEDGDVTFLGNLSSSNVSGTNTGDETLSTSSAGLDVSDHVVDLDVTPSSGSATLEQSEDALQVKYDSEAFAESASGLTIAAGGIDGGSAGDIADNTIDANDIASDAINLDEIDDGVDTPSATEMLVVATGATDVEYLTQQEVADNLEDNIDHNNLFNFVADEHVAHTSVNLTAGNGLTGGGDISINRTFDVVSGSDDITVNVDDITFVPANVDISEFGDSGGLLTTSWDEIADAAANATIDFLATEQVINISQTDGDVTAFELDINQADDADATDDLIGFSLDVNSESGDAGDTFTAMRILYENGTANTILDAALLIDNAETTASTVTDAIVITSSGVDGGVVTALNVSAANITNAIDIGANDFVYGTGVLSNSDFEILDDGTVSYSEMTFSDNIVAGDIAEDAINLSELDDGGDTPLAGEFVAVATGATDVEYLTQQQAADNLEDNIDHDNLLNFVANEHVDHTAVTITVAGTANEIASSAGAQDISASRTWTLSLPSVIDIGGKTSFELPNGSAPTTDVFGEIAGDDNAWAVSRGAIQAFDGTANTYLIGVLTSDTPTNGQVPKWNTDGTITWEDDGGGSSLTVEEADASPSVASVSTIQFDQADGFTVTDETGGQVQVDLASINVAGNITTSAGDIVAGDVNGIRVVDGTRFTTIQAAIDDVPASGGTVFVPAGTYSITTPIQVKDNLKLFGAGIGNTIIQAGGSVNLIIEDGAGLNNVEISGFTFDGQKGTHVGAAIVFDAGTASKIKIHDCEFLDVARSGFYLGGDGNTDVEVSNIVYNNIGTDKSHTSPGNSVIFYNNVVRGVINEISGDGCAWVAISVRSPNSSSRQITITNFNLNDSDYGISANGSATNSLTGLTISNGTIHEGKSVDTGNGIDVGGCKDVSISNVVINKTTNGFWGGINTDGSDQVTISNCVIEGMRNHGYNVGAGTYTTTTDVILSNNISLNNSGDGFADGGSSDLTGILAYGNRSFGNSGDQYDLDGALSFNPFNVVGSNITLMDGLGSVISRISPSSVFFDNTGNFSIGTASPSKKFQISHSFTTSDSDLVYTAQGRLGIGTTSPDQTIHMNNPSAATGFRVTANNNTTDFVQFTGGAFVGKDINNNKEWLRVNRSGSSHRISLGGQDANPDAVVEISAEGLTTDPFYVSSDDDNDGDLFKVADGGSIVANNATGGEIGAGTFNGEGYYKDGILTHKRNFHASFVNPDSLINNSSTDTLMVWNNDMGATVTIDSIRAWSDLQGYDFELYESGDTGGTKTLIDAVNVSQAGTGLAYVRETTITAGTIEENNVVWFKSSADDAKWVKFTVYYSY